MQLAGRHVILVDDGLATGATMRAAVSVVKQQHPQRLIVAVPVAAPDTRDALACEVDQVVCLHAPLRFQSVSQWYADFPQTSDEEVLHILHRGRTRPPDARTTSQFMR